MGVIVPNFASSTEDRASGAQVIDGSLRFDQSKSQYLTFTPTTTGNRRTWTFSCWFRKMEDSANRVIFSSYGSSPWTAIQTTGSGDGRIQATFDAGVAPGYYTAARYRDNGWYHLVWAVDTTQSTDPDKSKLYINGVLQTYESNAHPSLNEETPFNLASRTMYIGYTPNQLFDGQMSQCYFVDGQALSPTDFGYTDPLTNTWRPKKFDISKTPGGSWGTNGFYLPMDGNSPIGEDKSGRGNNWTPVNFGGSNTIEKATGALPILNTVNGGRVATVGVRTDAYASNLVLALPLVGSSADVSNQINSGSTTKTVTNSGVAFLSTQSNFYGISGEFGTSGDRLSVASSSDFTFGTGDFTIEGWIYPTNADTANKSIFSTNWGASGSILITYDHSTNKGFNLYDHTSSAGSPILSTPGVFESDKWYHIAVVRNSGTTKIYIDGIEHASASHTTNLTRDVFVVGAVYTTGTETWDGYIQDVRVYKGVAKYTSNFIPASTDPDILPDTPSGVSGSSKLTKITDGAVAFDGSSGYLSMLHNADFDLTNQDFTLEGYFNHNHTSGYVSGCGIWREANGADYWSYDLRMTHNGTVPAFIWTTDGTSVAGTLSATTPTGNSGWHHIAVTRSGTSLRIFVDGRLEGTTTTSDTINTASQQPFVCGYRGSTYYNGFMSNVRLIKGTALYTSDFTPPTRALTNVTNTKLLCCQSNTSAFGGTVLPALEPFSGAGSAEGGGTTSDYAQVTATGHSDFSIDGDFTVEWWHYRSSASANTYMWTVGDSANSTGLELYWGTTGSVLKLYTNGGATNVTATSGTGWHHYAVVRSSGTIKVYYDGTEGLSLSNSTTFNGNFTFAEFYNGNITGGFRGPMSQFRYVKGTAVYTSNFTAPTSALTAITNTKLLTFQGSALTDASGTDKTIQTFGNFAAPGSGFSINGNAAATNFNPFTTDIDAVRGQESGYATFNPLDIGPSSTLSIGNLYFQYTGGAAHRLCNSTISMSSGKWYWEGFYGHGTTAGTSGFGISKSPVNLSDSVAQTNVWAYHSNGNRYVNGSGSAMGATYTTGDLIGIAFDADSGTLYGYKNGVLQGTVATGLTSGPYFAVANSYSSSNWLVNFGQKPFKFPPPDGFQPLNASTARPSTVIARPDQYVKANIWSGDNTTRKITTGHHPDLVWIKCRSDGAGHRLFDTVRGTIESHRPGGANPIDTTNTFGAISAYHNDGFTLTPGSYGGYESGDVNMTGRTYVGWSWKAGGGSGATSGEYWIDDKQYADATAAGLNGGSGITLSGASVGTKQGFSILRYTGGASGSTLSHGLSQAPDFFIIKNHSGDTQGSAGPHWYVKHKSVSGGTTGNDSVFLNLTNGQGNNGPHGICRTSGDSLFEFVDGSSNDVNWHTHDSAATYSCYAWHDVPGLQKFGSYVGNTTAGPFVELGFRPAILWIKCITQTWYFAGFDAARNPYNPNDGRFIAFNNNGTESSGVHNNLDFLSNGFRIRSTSTNSEPTNLNGQTYIYCAWAEAPSFNLYGAQSNAR